MINSSTSLKQTEWFKHSNPIGFNPKKSNCDPQLYSTVEAQLKSKFRFIVSHEEPLKSVLYHAQLAVDSNRPVMISIKDKRALKKVLDGLEGLGYIELRKGRRNLKADYSYLSKYRPTELFEQTLANHSLRLTDVEHVRILKTKDADGNTVSRTPLNDSTNDGQCIKRFNEFIRKHSVQCDFRSGDFQPNNHLYGFVGNFDLNGQVVRIYTDHDGWGGRLYNTDTIRIQNLGKSVRKRITIDGESTVELDFKALHPSMIYNLEGLASPADAYAIFPDDPDGVLKACTKKAFNIFINSANVTEAVKGLTCELFSSQKALGEVLKQHYKSNPQSCVALLLQAVYKAHKPVKKWFCTSGWKTLQNKDADIMLLVLMNLMDKEIPALPIHDSVIVKKGDATKAYGIMKTVYKKMMGFDIQVV